MASSQKKTVYELQKEFELERRRSSYITGLVVCFSLSLCGFWLAWIEKTSPSASAPKRLLGQLFYVFGQSEGLVALGLIMGFFFLIAGIWIYYKKTPG